MPEHRGSRRHLAVLLPGLALGAPLLFYAGFATGKAWVPRPVLDDGGARATLPEPSPPARASEPEPDEPPPLPEEALPWPRIGAALERIDDLPEVLSHPAPAAAGASFRDLIERVARKHAMDPRLVTAMVRVESAFDPWAVSARGAQGLMQVLPATARRFEVDASRLHDPEQNLVAGVRYLSWLDERFDGDLPRVLAAYNAGEEAVEEHGGIPPFAETEDFVRRVLAAFDEED